MFRFLTAVAAVGVIAVSNGGRAHPSDGRIVGGRPGKIEDNPHQLSFEIKGIHDCGASLIKPNIAVTAAHCTRNIKKMISSLTIRAGSSLAGKGGQVAGLLCICDHPKYDQKTTDYDVSVLLLNQSLVLGDGVQTIRLLAVNDEVPTGKLATVSGWGALKNGGKGPEQLQVVRVPKVEPSKCEANYRKYGRSITNRMICFGFDKGGKDSCQGDSGGPLVFNGKLAGIVSWGADCAEATAPGVYTKVSHPEITSHIDYCVDRFKRVLTAVELLKG